MDLTKTTHPQKHWRYYLYRWYISWFNNLIGFQCGSGTQKYSVYGFRDIIYPSILGTYQIYQNSWYSVPSYYHYIGSVNNYENAIVHAMDIILNYINMNACFLLFSDGYQQTSSIYPQMWIMFKSWMAESPRNRCTCSACIWVGNYGISSQFTDLCQQMDASIIITNPNAYWGSA